MTSAPSAGRPTPEQLALLDELPQPSWCTDQTGSIFYVNSQMLAITGLPMEAFLGAEFLNVIHPAEVQHAERIRSEFLAAQAAGLPLSVEFRLKNAAGNYRWYCAQGRPSASGDYWLGTLHDIHETKITEIYLRRLQRSSDALARSHTREQVMHAALREGLPVLAAVAGLVVCLSEDTRTVETASVSGYPDDPRTAWPELALPTDWPASRSIRAGEPVYLSSRAALLELFPGTVTSPDIQARAALPLLVDGQVVGALILDFDREEAFGRAERAALTTLAGQVAQAALRARLHEQLQSSQQDLQATLDRSLSVVYVHDLTGRVRFVNQEFARLFRVDQRASVGRDLWSLLPPEVSAVWREREAPVLHSGHTQVFEETLLLPGGERHFTSVKFLLRDAAGEPYALCNKSIDVTARVEAEERARLSADRVRSLQSIAAAVSQQPTPRGVAEVVVEHASRALSASSIALATLDEARQHVTLLATRGADRAVVDRWRSYPLNFPSPLTDAIRQRAAVLVRDDGEAAGRYPELMGEIGVSSGVAWAGFPLVVHGRVLGAVTFGFDSPQAFEAEEVAFLQSVAQLAGQALERARLYQLEQQHKSQLEQLLQERTRRWQDLNAEVQAYTESVSEHIREPLRRITQILRLVQSRLEEQRSPLDDRSRQHLELLQQEAQRAQRRAEDLGKLARLELHELRLDTVPLGLLVQQVRSDITAGDEGEAVRWVIGELPGVRADALLLRRALAELLLLAMQAVLGTPEPALHLSAQAKGPQVRLHVRFEPTQEALHEIMAHPAGLDDARRIINRHGGRLTVRTTRREVRLELELPAG